MHTRQTQWTYSKRLAWTLRRRQKMYVEAPTLSPRQGSPALFCAGISQTSPVAIRNRCPGESQTSVYRLERSHDTTQCHVSHEKAPNACGTDGKHCALKTQTVAHARMHARGRALQAQENLLRSLPRDLSRLTNLRLLDMRVGVLECNQRERHPPELMRAIYRRAMNW